MNRTIHGRSENTQPGSAITAATVGIFLSIIATAGQAQDFHSTEVERLQQLLRRYHGQEQPVVQEDPLLGIEAHAQMDAAPDRTAHDARLALPFSERKVLLRTGDTDELINLVEARLADATIADRRNDAPLIGALQQRRDGAFLGNRTFSFAHVGKHQFVARTRIDAGRNLITAVEEQWTVELPEGTDGEYLLVLYAPPIDAWTLQILPLPLPADSSPTWLDAVLQGITDRPDSDLP